MRKTRGISCPQGEHSVGGGRLCAIFPPLCPHVCPEPLWFCTPISTQFLSVLGLSGPGLCQRSSFLSAANTPACPWLTRLHPVGLFKCVFLAHVLLQPPRSKAASAAPRPRTCSSVLAFLDHGSPFIYLPVQLSISTEAFKLIEGGKPVVRLDAWSKSGSIRCV